MGGGEKIGLQSVRERIDGAFQPSGLLVNILVPVSEEKHHN